MTAKWIERALLPWFEFGGEIENGNGSVSWREAIAEQNRLIELVGVLVGDDYERWSDTVYSYSPSKHPFTKRDPQHHGDECWLEPGHRECAVNALRRAENSEDELRQKLDEHTGATASSYAFLRGHYEHLLMSALPCLESGDEKCRAVADKVKMLLDP